jgi:hypothetical protein
METTFYIVLNMKTPDGLESYGRFNIGNDRQKAYHIFRKLKGDPDTNEKHVLCMELMETVNNLPVNIHMLGCSLNELSENCRIITKEIFNAVNLDNAL